MIQGIQGYNNAQGTNLGETSNKLEAGNYICRILGVKTTQNKSGSPMLVLQFDIAEGVFVGYYTELYNNQVKQNKDVKYRGLYYQNMTGNSLRFYKGLLETLEKSNNIKIDGENGFNESLLKNKKFLGRFGEEEFEASDGSIKTMVRLRYITSLDKTDLPILEKKTITPLQKPQNTDNFYSTGTNLDDDNLPF